MLSVSMAAENYCMLQCFLRKDMMTRMSVDKVDNVDNIDKVLHMNDKFGKVP